MDSIIDKMRDALKFYADRFTYAKPLEAGYRYQADPKPGPTKIENDKGAKARAVLEELAEEN